MIGLPGRPLGIKVLGKGWVGGARVSGALHGLGTGGAAGLWGGLLALQPQF